MVGLQWEGGGGGGGGGRERTQRRERREGGEGRDGWRDGGREVEDSEEGGIVVVLTVMTLPLPVLVARYRNCAIISTYTVSLSRNLSSSLPRGAWSSSRDCLGTLPL